MDAEIIAVGSEILLGQIANTNAQFLSKQFAEMGINVYNHTVVGDNDKRLKQAIEIAETRANLIVFTGGLGPTKDDLTKETIAQHLGKKLVFDELALQSIEDFFQKTNRQMTENNKKQALVLEGCHVLPNDHGMAPGMVLNKAGILYMLLPGPPKEMQPMFSTYGQAVISKKLNKSDRIESRVLRFYGIGEAELETVLLDLLETQTNPTIAPLAADGEVTIRITAKGESKEECNRLISEVEAEIQRRVGQYFYGYDQTSIMNELIKELNVKGFTLAVAESLTGGMFQENLTSHAGVSAIFKGGIVSYATEVKQEVLGVRKETIQSDGVVSEQCAKEMAINVCKQFNSSIGLSFTGVAGPDEQEGKSVGTVYIGVAYENGRTFVHRLQLSGSRSQIRIRSVKKASHLLLQDLQKQ